MHSYNANSGVPGSGVHQATKSRIRFPANFPRKLEASTGQDTEAGSFLFFFIPPTSPSTLYGNFPTSRSTL